MECDEDKHHHIILLACIIAMHAARPVKMIIPSTFTLLAPLVAGDSQSKPHPEQGGNCIKEEYLMHMSQSISGGSGK